MYTRPPSIVAKPNSMGSSSLSQRPTAFARTGTTATGTSSYTRPVVVAPGPGTVKAIPPPRHAPAFSSSLFCCMSATPDSRTLTPPVPPASRYALPSALSGHGTRSAVAPSAAGPGSSVAAVSATSKVASDPALCCDKCNGKHETDACPIYKKPRENHPDAQKNFYKSFGNNTTLPGGHLGAATVVRQPVCSV